MVERVAERYPVIVVDRPLLTPRGVTSFDPSVQMRTHVVPTMHGAGTITYDRTGFADDWNVDLAVRRSYGPVELQFGLGKLARASVLIGLSSLPLAMSIGLYTRGPQQGDRYFDGQSIGFRHKLVLVEHHLALETGASASLTEQLFHDTAGKSIEGIVLDAGGGVAAVVQLARNWCVYGGINGGVPFQSNAALGYHSYVSASLSLQLSLKKWDFFVNSAVSDITHHPGTFLNIGFTKRWGL